MNEEELQSVASQLACPEGEAGIVMADNMNKANEFIVSRSIACLAPVAGESIVEIGPGNGQLSVPIVELLGKEGLFCAVERSAIMAAATTECLQGEGMAGVDVFCGDYLAAPIKLASMDAVLAVNVLYFVEELEVFFNKLLSWLKPGARAVFAVRSPEAMRRMPFTKYGFNARSCAEIERLMQRCGFVHVDSSYYDEGMVTLGDVEIPVDSIIIRGFSDPGCA